MSYVTVSFALMKTPSSQMQMIVYMYVKFLQPLNRSNFVLYIKITNKQNISSFPKLV